MRLKKWFLWIALALVVLAGALIVLRRGGQKAPKYRTAPVSRGDVTMTVSATGAISAVTTVQVGSQVSGIIAKLYADFNSRVKKGQLLAELDPTPFQQAVDQQSANVANAKVNAANTRIALGRQQKLLQEGLAAQADFDNAKAAADSAAAQVNVSRAALAQAETNLKYSKIFSPVDGVVVNRAYDVGQTVAASFQAPTLFTIAQDLTKMQVQADTDESDIGRVKVGQPVSFTVDAYPDKVFHARVAQIRLNATVNQNVVTYPVMVAVDNPDQQLRPSMTANITIDVAADHDVLRIPNAALRFKPSPGGAGRGSAAAAPSAGAPNSASGGAPPRPTLAGSLPKTGRRDAGPTVYVLSETGALKAVRVHPGITDGQFTEIRDGDMEVGQMVVTGLATVKAESQSGPRMRF
ncbi:MAG: efflux RND transporter periplasmic adaptor subunit [Thermoanaerobaculia bacterium]